MDSPRHSWECRPARMEEAEALEALITISVETLQAHCYSAEQRRAAMGPVFGVDRQLIRDGTYYAVDAPDGSGALIACGGWSRRQSLFGSDAGRSEPEPLVPGRDAARIRAFFVHPDWARQGLGRALLHTCEAALAQAGFTEISLVATLPGIPLYAAHGYTAQEHYDVPLTGELTLPVVRMGRFTKSVNNLSS